jgi:DeoR/GlpR family transcriptional regulator of sugar metabolism
MRAAERLLRVQELFANEEFLELDVLCKRLKASKSSVRRDLIELERQGVLRRVHGGAISLQVRDEVLDYARLSTSCQREKTLIGKAAAGLIEDGQTVILGGGSTVVEVARNLVDRPLQIITNSIPVAQVFWECKRAEVTLTGGYLYPRLGLLLGEVCERTLQSVAADVLIMGVRGITENGFSDTNTFVVQSIKDMMKVARKVIVVADHTKFGLDAMVSISRLQAVQAVVSDSALELKHQRMFKNNGIGCLLAAEPVAPKRKANASAL